MIERLTGEHGLSQKDAVTLLSLDDGDRLDYFLHVMSCLRGFHLPNDDQAYLGKIAGNWYVIYQTCPGCSFSLILYRVLMELGSLFGDREWSPTTVRAEQLASIIMHLQRRTITSRSAKKLLLMKFEGDVRLVTDIIEQEDMTLRPLSPQEYSDLARILLKEKPEMVKDIVDKGQSKKIKWFVGQMMLKSREGSIEPDVAEEVLKRELGVR